MTKAIYYHAGCAICVEAERSLLPLLDHKQVDIEVVHLAEQSARIAEAEKGRGQVGSCPGCRRTGTAP